MGLANDNFVHVIYLVGFVVLSLATARLTRLAYFDDITIRMRMWVDRKYGQNSFPSKMIWCPWCSSVWVSILTCPFAMTGMWLWGGWPLGGAMWATMLLVPAVSYVAGWVVAKETSGSD